MKQLYLRVLAHSNDHNNPKLGIFDDENRVVSPYTANKDGVKKYHFILEIYYGNMLDKSSSYSEVIDFYYTCDLSHFQELRQSKIPGHEDIEFINTKLEDIVELAEPEQFEYLKNRLYRKASNIIPDKVEFQCWRNDNGEFLEFTKETAYNWAGPFEHNEKAGCLLTIRPSRYSLKDELVPITDTIEFPILDVYTQYRYYQLPYNKRQELDIIAKESGYINGDYMMAEMTDEQRKELFQSFSVKDQHVIFKNFMRFCDKEWLESLLPYSICLAGNDDCTYSKWFATKEEMDTEIEYLRKMQPLDFSLDILNRKYIFTN